MTTESSAVHLLDGNVLVALVVKTHEHHEPATAWFGQGLAYSSCPITQGTVLRMLVRLGHGAAEAATILDRLTGRERHTFWPDDRSFDGEVLQGVQGHRQVTDAYLAALCREHAGRLVTLDRGLAVTHADVATLIEAT